MRSGVSLVELVTVLPAVTKDAIKRCKDVSTSAVFQDAAKSLYSLVLALVKVSAATGELSVDHPRPHGTNLRSRGPSPLCHPAHQSYSVAATT